MNFSAGLSLFRNLVQIGLGSVFECHTDSSLQIYKTISFSNLATMIQSNYITHILENL